MAPDVLDSTCRGFVLMSRVGPRDTVRHIEATRSSLATAEKPQDSPRTRDLCTIAYNARQMGVAN